MIQIFKIMKKIIKETNAILMTHYQQILVTNNQIALINHLQMHLLKKRPINQSVPFKTNQLNRC